MNGISPPRPFGPLQVQAQFATDASSSVGCRAVYPPYCLQYKWGDSPYSGVGSNQEDSITYQELLRIIFACAVWGSMWRNTSVVVQSDNQGVVAVVNSGYSKIQPIMHLSRCLFFIWSRYNISLHVVYHTGHTMYWQMLSPVITYPSSPRSRQRCHAAPLCPHHSAHCRYTVSQIGPLIVGLSCSAVLFRRLSQLYKRSYQSGANRYIRFCSLFGVTPYPTTERSLSHFVGYLFQEGLSASTVKGYLLIGSTSCSNLSGPR